jgi:hypothetical protein
MNYYNRCHGDAVKEFWAIQDDIYDCVYYFRFSRHFYKQFTSFNHNTDNSCPEKRRRKIM